jgi:hypothetical protein
MYSLPNAWHWAGALSAYTLSYPLIRRGLECTSSRYRALDPVTQTYVSSNLLKAGVLAGITCVHATGLRDIVLHDRWDADLLLAFAPWYAALDVVSLAQVRRMMRSTLVHHVLVGLCGVYVSTHRIGPGTLSGQIAVYALFSSLAWFVNGFLGARYLMDDHSKALTTAARTCGLGYAAVCAVHWTFQAHCVWRAPQSLWCLPVLFAGFVQDDVVLMRWLMGYHR